MPRNPIYRPPAAAASCAPPASPSASRFWKAFPTRIRSGNRWRGHPPHGRDLLAAWHSHPFPFPGAPSFRNSISVDQFAAESIGHLTRFPSLSLSAGSSGLSYTRSGVRIPPEKKPTDSTRLFTFLGSGGAEVVPLKGVDDGWHNLSHHGKDPLGNFVMVRGCRINQ